MGLNERVVETGLDLAKNENVQNKLVDLLSILFPYIGIEKKAVDLYTKEIENSNLSADSKVIALFNTKKTLKQLKNQNKIVEIASSNIKGEIDNISKVNEEWLDRFMDSAGFVSSEEMQFVWGKILANEIETPGATPPNMIRILSEITPELARIFKKLCSMKVYICLLSENDEVEHANYFVLVPYNGNSEEFHNLGISFNILNELETLGLIKFDPIAGYISKGIQNKKILMFAGGEEELIIDHQENVIPKGNVLFTSVGEVLRKITENEDIPNYNKMIKRYMMNHNVKFANEHDFKMTIDENSVFVTKNNN